MKTLFTQHPRYRFNRYRIVLFSVFMLVTGFFSANVKADLLVTPTSITLQSAAGSSYFPLGIYSSAQPWNIYNVPSWLRVSQTSGPIGATDITVTATSVNNGTTTRYADISISATGEWTKYVRVTQLNTYLIVGLLGSGSLIPLNAFLPSSWTFSITSNTSWTITENTSWFSVSPSTGTNNGTVTVTATSENPATSSRSATITVSGTGVPNQTVDVLQWGQGWGCLNETFMAYNGTVTDNSGTSYYQNGMSCEKLIQPPGATSITLTFTEFETEERERDLVRVYDGATEFFSTIGYV